MRARHIAHAVAGVALCAVIAAPAHAADSTFAHRFTFEITAKGHQERTGSGTSGRDACPNPYTMQADSKWNWSESFTGAFEGFKLSDATYDAFAKQDDQSVGGSGTATSKVNGEGDGCVHASAKCSYRYALDRSSSPGIIGTIRGDHVRIVWSSPSFVIKQAKRELDPLALEPEACIGDFDELSGTGPQNHLQANIPLAAFKQSTTVYDWTLGGAASKTAVRVTFVDAGDHLHYETPASDESGNKVSAGAGFGGEIKITRHG